MKQLFVEDNEAYVLTGTSYFTIFNEFEQSYKRDYITLSSTNTKLKVKAMNMSMQSHLNFHIKR